MEDKEKEVIDNETTDTSATQQTEEISATPATEEEPVENKPKNRWQELALEYTEEEASSEDEAYDLIKAELEDLTEWKRTEKQINEKLVDALNAEPDFQQLVGYVLKGASFKEALVRTIDIESLTPAEGDPDRAAWEKAKEERIERLKKIDEEDRLESERMSARQTNLGNTKALINDFAEKHKMSDGEVSTLKGKLAQFTRDILDMKVDEDTLDMILKSIRMEKIIEEAKEEAATDERNRKIEVMRQKREDSTDGLPSLDAGSDTPVEEKKGLQSIFDDVLEKHGRNK